MLLLLYPSTPAKTSKINKDISIPFKTHLLQIFLRVYKEVAKKKKKKEKKKRMGVPVVAQWLTNPTRNHEVEGSIPDIAQCIKDPALP